MDVVRVEWVDTGLSLTEGWVSAETIIEKVHGDKKVVSVGFVMHEDDEVLVLTQSYDPAHDTHMNGQAILKSAITTWRTLT